MDIEQPKEYHRYRRYFVDLGKKLYQEKKSRVYSGIILSILTITFFLSFAIRPTLVTIASLLKEIENQKVVAEKLQDKITALNTAQIEYQKIKKDLVFVDETLPIHPDISSLITQLEVLARDSNLSVDGIQFSRTVLKDQEGNIKNSKIKEGPPGIDFTLAVVGDYKNLISFLDSLTNLRRLVLIDTFALHTGSTDENLLLLNLKANVHFSERQQ